MWKNLRKKYTKFIYRDYKIIEKQDKIVIEYLFEIPELSIRDFNKYVKALKKAGFEINPAEANGYYAAKSADKFYVEATLVSGNITVYIKRV